MTIEKLHGLHATTITLNDRFTLLAEAPPPGYRVKRRIFTPTLSNRNFNFRNQNLLQQIAYHLQRANKQRVPGLQRFNSAGNLSQLDLNSRLSWRQPKGNLSRSNSFNNLATVWSGQGFRRRGTRMGLSRGRIRGRGVRQQVGRMHLNGPQAQRGRASGAGRGRGAGRARTTGRGRGNAKIKPVPTKEELDLQLDQYMASTKSVLDKQLDAYIKSAIELE